MIRISLMAISIHAPARGATNRSGEIRGVIRHFNPRSREGSDEDGKDNNRGKFNFNPRSREGSDPTGITLSMYFTVFQSTLPRGERRPLQRPKFCEEQRFQSTLPRGERPKAGVQIGETVNISIHAPARGATNRTSQSERPDSHFNPRSREGSD